LDCCSCSPREKNQQKRSESQGLKFRDVSKIEKQDEDKQDRKRRLFEMQTFNLESPVSEKFKRDTHVQSEKRLINLSVTNYEEYCDTGLLVGFLKHSHVPFFHLENQVLRVLEGRKQLSINGEIFKDWLWDLTFLLAVRAISMN
jgi:hypothetical protein